MHVKILTNADKLSQLESGNRGCGFASRPLQRSIKLCVRDRELNLRKPQAAFLGAAGKDIVLALEWGWGGPKVQPLTQVWTGHP